MDDQHNQLNAPPIGYEKHGFFSKSDLGGVDPEELRKDLERLNDQDKYFTPDISDIRVGYECEIQVEATSDGGKTFVPEWRTDRVGRGTYILGMFDAGKVRVPYLTAEQIEKEGWVDDGTIQGDVYRMNKLPYMLVHCPVTRKLSIFEFTAVLDEEDKCLFYGECKDINTFRYICKLLGI